MRIDSAVEFTDYWRGVRKRTTRVIEQIRQTPAGTPITAWKWLRAMVEHEAHHRRQLYLLLGMRGVTVPQIFGLPEEEVKARRGH
jgi:uncharacterized damage-inducible protein DinB